MHDPDHDALPLSLDGADGPNNGRLLVAATVTALLLAGSAMVYRTVSNTMASASKSAASFQDSELDTKSKPNVVDASVKCRSVGEGGVDTRDAEDENNTNLALSAPLPTKPDLDLEASKEAKSSRSKDRRRRGKDPLKEILKGGKKAKALTSTLTTPKGTSSSLAKGFPYDYNNDPEYDNDTTEYEQHASPASSSTSLLPSSATHSLSRVKGKHAHRNSAIDPTGHTHSPPGGSSSTSHSRNTSTSGASQKQALCLDSPFSQHSDDRFHPSQGDDLASEENNGRPHSRMSTYSTSSLSHSHTSGQQPHLVNLDDVDAKEIGADLGSHSRSHSRATPSLDENSQAHQGLARGIVGIPKDARQEGEGEALSGNNVWMRDPSTFSSTLTTTTNSPTAGLVDADGFSKPKSKSKSKTSTSSVSSSVSMDTNTTDTTMTTTTDTTSMTSSLVMTPATSPLLSSKTTPTLAKISPAKDNHDNDTPTSSLATGIKSKNLRKTPSAATSSPKTSVNKTLSPWDWDGVGHVDVSPPPPALDTAAASVITSVTGVGRNSREKEFKDKESDSYKKPPRLQRAKGGATTFSAMVASGISSQGVGLTTASSHPVSLYSPTNATFEGSSFRSGLPTSTSSAAFPVVGETEVFPVEELSNMEREEDEAFTFPTLNPTTTTSSAASSRTRSSLADTNNTNHYNNNTLQINNQRRPRPTTPSRSNLSSSTSHTPPPSTSSPASQPGSLSSNGGVNANGSGSSSVANSNASAGGVLLSTQTQLASLRGALEAARLREDKHKAEMEKAVKEIDVLRWEHANSRRGEVELQAHVRQLMQQLQASAALFASMVPQLNAQYQQYYIQQQQQLQQALQQPSGSSTANPGGTFMTAGLANGNTVAPTSATLDVNTSSSSSAPSTTEEPSTSTSSSTPSASAQTLQGQIHTPTHQPSNQPPPLQIPHFPAFQMNGMNGMPSPAGMLSPILGVPPMSPSVMGVPYMGGASNFFPYAVPPHPHAPPTPHPHAQLFSHAQQMQFMQQQYQQQHNFTQAQAQSQAQPSPRLASSFSMLSPPSMPSPYQHHQVYATGGVFGTGNGSSSGAGTSSVESLSPDLGGLPSSGAPAVNGKKRVRTRTQITNGRMSARGGGAAVGIWEEATGDVGADDVIEEEPVKESVDGLLGGPLRRVNGHASVDNEVEEQDGFNEGGLNELLADAILKRPGSIRVRSKKERPVGVGGAESSEKEVSPTKENVVVEHEVEPTTEFIFPSLSDLGNVRYRSDGRKVNGDSGLSEELSEAAVSCSLPSIAPDAQVILELLEGDAALAEVTASFEQSVGRSFKPEVDTAPTDSRDTEATVEPESSPNFDKTETFGAVPTAPVSHSEEQIEPIVTLPALEEPKYLSE